MTLDEIIPWVQPDVIGCPEPTVRQAIVSAVAELCSTARIWSEIQDPIELEEGIADYDLDGPSQAYAVLVMDLYVGPDKLQAVTMDQLQQSLPDWRTATAARPCFYNSAVTQGSVRIYPIPKGVQPGTSLVMRVAYMPSTGASSIPDFIGQGYMDTIAAGAKARLMRIPGQVFSNPTLAMHYRQQFDAGVVDARINEAYDRVPGCLTVQARPFGI